MRVLYVLSVQAEDTSAPMDALAELEPSLEVATAAGAAAALVEIRARGGYRAVFLSPQLPHNEALALVATLRRDRAPVAIVAIITESERSFLAPIITAGADDVLVMRESGFVTAEETLRRVGHSRHLERPADHPRLQVLYVGQDDLAWDLLADMPFVRAGRATAAIDGSCPLGLEGGPARADVIIVDEQPGGGHALQVVKWLQANAPGPAVVVLTAPTGHDVGGAALELGADDVVSKAGTYRRRLVATLHRHYLRVTGVTGLPAGARIAKAGMDAHRPVEPEGPVEPEEPGEPEGLVEPVVPDELDEPGAGDVLDEPIAPVVPENEDAEIARIRMALAAETRIRDLTAEVHSLGARLDAHRRSYDELLEAQKFEGVLRERDREELQRLSQALAEERERRIVLEGTLRQTEDRAAADAAAIEARHAEARRDLDAQLAAATDRLRQIADESQAQQTRLRNELTDQAADRDRLVQSQVFGWAAVSLDGALLLCNTAFARMFGFLSAADALAGSGAPFAGLADHAHVVQQLQSGANVDRVETTLQRNDGRPFRAVTSAAFRATGGQPPTIERVVVDLDDRTQMEERLRLARRLEAAGRLTAEMAPEIEPLLPALEDPEAPADRRRAVTLVRQLLAFSRHQAKPAGLLSLYDAVRRAEPLLRRIAGDTATFELRLHDVGAVAASEEDLELMLSALVFAAAASLPYGGTITLDTRSVRTGFDQRIELAVGAAGYGVHSASISASLARLVTRSGGTVHVSDDPARSTTLHVHLPC